MTDVSNPIRRYWPRQFVIWGLCLTMLSLVIFWWWQPSAERLLTEGLAQMRYEPVASERLVRRAIQASRKPYPDAQISLCRLLVRRRAWQEADALLSTIDQSKCRSELLLAFGQEALSSRLRQRAVDALECVAAGDQNHAVKALELLVADYNEWGQREKLIDAVKKLTRLQPDNPKYWANLIEYLTAFGYESDCIEATQAALQRDLPVEFRREFQNSLVQQLVNRGNTVAARRELSELKKVDGDSIRVRGLDVYICRLEGRLDVALEIATSIVNESPQLIFAHFTRGVIYLDRRQFAEAATEFERTVAAEPGNAPARFKLSESYRGLGYHEKAAEQRNRAAEIVERQKRISVLIRAREADPLNPATYAELELLHRELDDFQSAHRWHAWAIRVSELSGKSLQSPDSKSTDSHQVMR